MNFVVIIIYEFRVCSYNIFFVILLLQVFRTSTPENSIMTSFQNVNTENSHQMNFHNFPISMIIINM